MKDSPDNKNRDNKYDKIRHLVEVDDDILAVFSLYSTNSPDMKELYIAKNANIDKNYVDSLLHISGSNQVINVEKSQISAIGQEEEIQTDEEFFSNLL